MSNVVDTSSIDYVISRAVDEYNRNEATVLAASAQRRRLLTQQYVNSLVDYVQRVGVVLPPECIDPGQRRGSANGATSTSLPGANSSRSTVFTSAVARGGDSAHPLRAQPSSEDSAVPLRPTPPGPSSSAAIKRNSVVSSQLQGPPEHVVYSNNTSGGDHPTTHADGIIELNHWPDYGPMMQSACSISQFPNTSAVLGTSSSAQGGQPPQYAHHEALLRRPNDGISTAPQNATNNVDMPGNGAATISSSHVQPAYRRGSAGGDGGNHDAHKSNSGMAASRTNENAIPLSLPTPLTGRGRRNSVESPGAVVFTNRGELPDGRSRNVTPNYTDSATGGGAGGGSDYYSPGGPSQVGRAEGAHTSVSRDENSSNKPSPPWGYPVYAGDNNSVLSHPGTTKEYNAPFTDTNTAERTAGGRPRIHDVLANFIRQDTPPESRGPHVEAEENNLIIDRIRQIMGVAKDDGWGGGRPARRTSAEPGSRSAPQREDGPSPSNNGIGGPPPPQEERRPSALTFSVQNVGGMSGAARSASGDNITTGAEAQQALPHFSNNYSRYS